MRIKFDFVTNSSTCAFIMVGWEVKLSVAEEIEKKFVDIAVEVGTENGATSNDKALVGINLDHISDDYFDEETKFYELFNLVRDTQLDKVKREFNLPDQKLIFGRAYC